MPSLCRDLLVGTGAWARLPHVLYSPEPAPLWIPCLFLYCSCLVLGAPAPAQPGVYATCFRSTYTPVAATATAVLATCLSLKRSCSGTRRVAGR